MFKKRTAPFFFLVRKKDEITFTIYIIICLVMLFSVSYGFALESSSDDAEVYMDKGGASYKQGDYDTAISYFTQAIKINPKIARAYYNRGVAYLRKEAYDKAIEDFSQALNIDPKYPDAYINRAALYSSKGLYEKASEDYLQEIKLRPRNYRAYYGLGCISAVMGKFDVAGHNWLAAYDLGKYTELGDIILDTMRRYYHRIIAYTVMLEIKEKGIAERFYIREIQPLESGVTGGVTLSHSQIIHDPDPRGLLEINANKIIISAPLRTIYPRGDGSVFEFVEKVSFENHTFISEKTAPLIFVLIKGIGLTYVEGKGKFVMKNGDVITLPITDSNKRK